MTISQAPNGFLSDSWHRAESLLSAFEESWQTGSVPRLEDFLHGDSTARRACWKSWSRSTWNTAGGVPPKKMSPAMLCLPGRAWKITFGAIPNWERRKNFPPS